MPELSDQEERRRRRIAAANLAVGGSMIGGAAAAQEHLSRSTGVKNTLDAAKQVARGRTIKPRHARYVGGMLSTRGIAAAGVPLAAVGAKNLLAPRPKKIERPDLKEDVLEEAVDRTAVGLPSVKGKKNQSNRARTAELATVGAGSTLGGIAGSSLARRAAKGKLRLAAIGTSTALGAAGGAVAASPFARRAVRRSTEGKYDYSTERGTYRVKKSSVSKLASGDAAINTLAQHEQRQLVARKKKQSTYSLASAGLGAAALGLQAPRLANVALKAKRLRNVKALKRVSGVAPTATGMSNTVGIGALGVGSLGSLNFARIQRSESKADERSARAMKVKKALYHGTSLQGWKGIKRAGHLKPSPGSGGTGVYTTPGFDHGMRFATHGEKPHYIRAFNSPERAEQLIAQNKRSGKRVGRVMHIDDSAGRPPRNIHSGSEEYMYPGNVPLKQVKHVQNVNRTSETRWRSKARQSAKGEVPIGQPGHGSAFTRHRTTGPLDDPKIAASIQRSQARLAQVRAADKANKTKVRKMHLSGDRTRQIDVARAMVSKMGDVRADQALATNKYPYGAQRTLQDVDDYYRIAHGGRSKAERIEHFMDKNIAPHKAKAKQARVAREISQRRTVEGLVNMQNFIRHSSGGKDPSDHDFAVTDELARRRKAGLPKPVYRRSKAEIRGLKARQALVHEHRARGTRPPPRQPDPEEAANPGYRDLGEKFYRTNPHPKLGNPYKVKQRELDVAKALIRVPKFPRIPTGFGGVKTGAMVRTASGKTVYRRGSMG